MPASTVAPTPVLSRFWLRPTEVDAGRVRAFIEAKLAEGVNPATIRIFVAILSGAVH